MVVDVSIKQQLVLTKTHLIEKNDGLATVPRYLSFLLSDHIFIFLIVLLSSLAIEVIIFVLSDISKRLSGSLATKILILCQNLNQIFTFTGLFLYNHRIVLSRFRFDCPQRYLALIIKRIDGVA